MREVVEEAVADVKHALTRLDEVYAEYAMEDADFDALAKEQGELEAVIQAKDGHNLDNQLEVAADADEEGCSDRISGWFQNFLLLIHMPLLLQKLSPMLLQRLKLLLI